jgi:hypothetical protein
MIRQLLAAAPLAALAAPAFSQSNFPPDLRRIGDSRSSSALVGRVQLVSCRQGECSWARFLDVRRLPSAPQGELLELRYRSAEDRDGLPRSRLRWSRQVHPAYVFCSRVRPAHAFRDENGGLIVHYLDLFDIAGYQQGSAVMYMRLCHDRGPAAADVLRRLGYRRGTRNEQVEGGRPEDMARF